MADVRKIEGDYLVHRFVADGHTFVQLWRSTAGRQWSRVEQWIDDKVADHIAAHVYAGDQEMIGYLDTQPFGAGRAILGTDVMTLGEAQLFLAEMSM